MSHQEAMCRAAEGSRLRIVLREGRSAHDVVRSLQLTAGLLRAEVSPDGETIVATLALVGAQLTERVCAIREQAAVLDAVLE